MKKITVNTNQINKASNGISAFQGTFVKANGQLRDMNFSTSIKTVIARLEDGKMQRVFDNDNQGLRSFNFGKMVGELKAVLSNGVVKTITE